MIVGALVDSRVTPFSKDNYGGIHVRNYEKAGSKNNKYVAP